MTRFSNDVTGAVSAEFEAEDLKDLKSLQTALDAGRLTDAKTQLDEQGKKLSMTAQGN